MSVARWNTKEVRTELFAAWGAGVEAEVVEIGVGGRKDEKGAGLRSSGWGAGQRVSLEEDVS